MSTLEGNPKRHLPLCYQEERFTIGILFLHAKMGWEGQREWEKESLPKQTKEQNK
jgi:hypothetical protein